ncbi:MAG: hypothetical protein RIB93_05570 [Coleofasciculus sp. D1-CHI-01]|uniref:hypothetical protein n=1 Tax=Coleofasciculus sp. D1-CHI-01 TaxID=3068482 RepID=UPI0032FEED3C
MRFRKFAIAPLAGLSQNRCQAVIMEQDKRESDRALDMGQPDWHKQTDKKCT